MIFIHTNIPPSYDMPRLFLYRITSNASSATAFLRSPFSSLSRLIHRLLHHGLSSVSGRSCQPQEIPCSTCNICWQQGPLACKALRWLFRPLAPPARYESCHRAENFLLVAFLICFTTSFGVLIFSSFSRHSCPIMEPKPPLFK